MTSIHFEANLLGAWIDKKIKIVSTLLYIGAGHNSAATFFEIPTTDLNYQVELSTKCINVKSVEIKKTSFMKVN